MEFAFQILIISENELLIVRNEKFRLESNQDKSTVYAIKPELSSNKVLIQRHGQSEFNKMHENKDTRE